MDSGIAARRRAIAVICVVSHVLAAASFGAVFWIDAIEYGNLAFALAQPGGLGVFYDGTGTWTLSHLQPGLPLLGMALHALPAHWQWPALACLQHVLAAGATFVLFTALDRRWPSRAHVAGAALLSFLPFYQASHASFMTESLTASLLMLGLAAAIALEGSGRRAALLGGLVACVLLATQLRSYAGLLLAAGAAPFLLRRGWRALLPMGALAAVTLAGVLAFPAYRAIELGRFWLPAGGLNSAIAGWWADPRPSVQALAALARFPATPALAPERLVGRGLSYEQAQELGRHWRTLGWSDADIVRAGERMGDVLRRDGAVVLANRAGYAAVSSGFTWLYCAVPPGFEAFPGLAARALCEHHRRTYDLQSWVDDANKERMFRSFFGSPDAGFAFERQAKGALSDALRGHLQPPLPVALRDPLLLGRLPLDLLAAAGLVALAWLARREPRLALSAGAMLGLNALVAFSFPVANPRYAYALVPVYVVVACVAVARGRNRKSA